VALVEAPILGSSEDGQISMSRLGFEPAWFGLTWDNNSGKTTVNTSLSVGYRFSFPQTGRKTLTDQFISATRTPPELLDGILVN
jgi:hypothetical protein